MKQDSEKRVTSVTSGIPRHRQAVLAALGGYLRGQRRRPRCTDPERIGDILPGNPGAGATRPRHPPQAACRGARATIAPQVAQEPIVTPPSRLNPDRPGPTDLLSPERYRAYLVTYYELPADMDPAEKHRRAWRAALTEANLTTDASVDLRTVPAADLRTSGGPHRGNCP